MCRAMNRSLPNVMFAGVGAVVATEAQSADIYAGRVKAASPEEVAMLMEGARRVVIAPGYGMAVAQAQYAIQDLASALESRGVEVDFAVHPVAGRMPGHMNVLLAEANVPYEKLKDMEEINPTFRQSDVVLVIGANDVVNPWRETQIPQFPSLACLSSTSIRRVPLLSSSAALAPDSLESPTRSLPQTTP